VAVIEYKIKSLKNGLIFFYRSGSLEYPVVKLLKSSRKYAKLKLQNSHHEGRGCFSLT
jgi:hypothetical protein